MAQQKRRRSLKDKEYYQTGIYNLILEILKVEIPRYWQDVFDEFKETHDLETLQGDFSDLLYILLVTDKSNFPGAFDRVQAISILSQIHQFLSLMYTQQGKQLLEKETKNNSIKDKS